MSHLKTLLSASIFSLISLGSLPVIANSQAENLKAKTLFDDIFNAQVARSPMFQGYLGIKDNNDKWDDLSENFAEETHQLTVAQLKKLQEVDQTKLDEQTRLSYRLLEKSLKDDIADHKWRHHNYPVNQMFGMHSRIPAYLINIHQITDEEDARAYIRRLESVPTVLEQLQDGLEVRRKKSIAAPKFVFPHVIRDVNNIIAGAPFEKGNDSTLLADFRKKVSKLGLSEDKQHTLISQAQQALVKNVGPAYTQFSTYLTKLEKSADNRDGVWKFPDGQAFYARALESTTTTTLSADDIHTIGLTEVDRIHDEMRAIMKAVNFKGDLQAFFDFMRTDKQFYYPETEAGKQRYLKEATAIIDTMKGELDDLFIVKPKAEIIVKAVEPFREKSAGKAFYQRPSADGSRPGIYYANLYKMSDMPTYQMEALAYHEGIPGHHMQLSIAGEINDLPMFRKWAHYTAYLEGWGLYSEYLPKEIGFYKDPYSDFGRLAMELWRACRLVVDTGIHAKKWTRQEAIDYLAKNTPNPQNDLTKAIERYVVMPSQATSYKIGMIKILELRADAKKALGERFDIREFHDVVLKNGAVPLDVLEELIDQWIASKK